MPFSYEKSLKHGSIGIENTKAHIYIRTKSYAVIKDKTEISVQSLTAEMTTFFSRLRNVKMYVSSSTFKGLWNQKFN